MHGGQAEISVRASLAAGGSMAATPASHASCPRGAALVREVENFVAAALTSPVQTLLFWGSLVSLYFFSNVLSLRETMFAARTGRDPPSKGEVALDIAKAVVQGALLLPWCLFHPLIFYFSVPFPLKCSFSKQQTAASCFSSNL